MNGNKAKLKFNPNNFEIIEEGDYVVCSVSGKYKLAPLSFPAIILIQIHILLI